MIAEMVTEVILRRYFLQWGGGLRCLAVLAVVLSSMLSTPVAAQSTELDAATQRLFEAVENNDMSGVQISIGGGADINAFNEWGLTAVDLAVDKGHFKIVHYLLSVRNIRKTSPATPPPAPAPVVSVAPPPDLASDPVSEVITPPPGSDPWSATVVKSKPPAPPVRSGPSPFDAAVSKPPKSLPIIGEVRGQKQLDVSLPGAAVKPESPVAAPTKTYPQTDTKDPGFIESLMNKYLGIDPEPETKTVKEPPAPPTGETPVSTPPLIEGKLMPGAVEKTKLTTVPVGEMQKTRVMSVAPGPADEIMATIDDEDETKPTPKLVERSSPEPVRREPARQASAEPIGRTSPPGKPQGDSGWFEGFKSFFSFESNDSGKYEEAAKTKTDNADSSDWRVKEIEQAAVTPRPPVKKKQQEVPKNRLDGVILTLGRITALGKTPPPEAPSPWFYKTCINKRMKSIVFCIEPLDWPNEIKAKFFTDSVLYEGTQTIVRYDEGSATYFHTLFPTTSYADIVDFFSRRYGPPTEVLKRSIAPLAAPRMSNPTVIWKSRAPVTNLLTTLEIRQYDDMRGGFPDTKRGAVYLYHEWSQPVFPQLSSVELLLLRAEEKTR